jgi:hypothetical protein
MPLIRALAGCIGLIAVAALAQAPPAAEKPLSPPASARTIVAGKEISIQYSAPSMRGRKIMGGLVPFEKVWRTGANAATTLVTQGDLRIGTLAVPRGTYTIYTIPAAGSWTLIVNRQTGQWGTQYDESQDLGRVTMQLRALPSPVETFVITVEPTGRNRGVLKLTWETTEASVPFELVSGP